jgi:ATP-dependent RNA helicase DDX19/DBP5
MNAGTLQVLDGQGQSYLQADLPFDVLLERSQELLDAVYDLEFDHPSMIQTQTIQTLCGPGPRDLQAQAQSGSGKTVAFILSALLHVDRQIQAPQAVCVFHTRELTEQSYSVFKQLNKNFHATGGTVMARESHELPESTTQVLFGTPLSLLRAVRWNKFSFENLKLFVVDEADEIMAPKGNHFKPISDLIRFVPPTAQKAFFSATYSPRSTEGIRKLMKNNAITVTLSAAEQRVNTVAHWVANCASDAEAFETFVTLYKVKHTGQTVVFVQTKAEAPELTERLNKEGLTAVWFGGQLSHEDRERIITDFREGKIKVLITTDVLSRGFDVPATFLVVNWTPPMVGRESKRGEHVDPARYYHRAGRAGRFGRTGLCFTFVRSDRELQSLRWCCGQYKLELKMITKERLGELPDEQVVPPTSPPPPTEPAPE